MILLQLTGVRLTGARYDEIEKYVVEMYEECGLYAVPIDCFAIAQKLGYVLVPYSYLSQFEQAEAFEKSDEGYSEIHCLNGMYRYFIYFNDYEPNHRRIRFTIFHEIGHCYLGHLDDDEGKSYAELESEANFFARTAIAPLPLICSMELDYAEQISCEFDVSYTASCHILHAYKQWLRYGSRYYLDHEIKLLDMFGLRKAA
ncbi:MAG: ImmA/IrrE family metallo-endopeptidase [Butyrivibrio sp.]|nr:ImmA/IrrE family metallo-endopeptidase [Butyrivibrio sp.]